MNEIRREILLVATIFLLVAIIATPLVVAKPGAEKNNDKFMDFVWYTTNPLFPPDVGGTTVINAKTNPAWAEGSDVIVTHTYGEWFLDPAGEHYVEIGNSQYPIDPVTGYEGFLYVQSVAFSETYTGLNYRVYEKIMWDDNYIEIMANERATADTSTPIPVFNAAGTFSGHGVVDGQNVQVMGIREGYIDLVAGAFILENSGTIQFVGK